MIDNQQNTPPTQKPIESETYVFRSKGERVFLPSNKLFIIGQSGRNIVKLADKVGLFYPIFYFMLFIQELRESFSGVR